MGCPVVFGRAKRRNRSACLAVRMGAGGLRRETTAGTSLLDNTYLQERILGLGPPQVVHISSGFNSYEMESLLGRQWSAWSNAVNALIQSGGTALSDPVSSDLRKSLLGAKHKMNAAPTCWAGSHSIRKLHGSVDA